uniref:Candidate secreted effector n=1 Tax=Meloidogyne incognita TaxID=6306 RepID=A0A914N700_MELIC
MKFLKKPIEISRITTKINNIVFNIEYIINGENGKDFFVEQQGNVGILYLSKPIKGPRKENIQLNINVMSRKGVSIAHNLALIQIYVSRWNF